MKRVLLVSQSSLCIPQTKQKQNIKNKNPPGDLVEKKTFHLELAVVLTKLSSFCFND